MPYSQYEEEIIIAEFFGPNFIGRFLDIGAADGVRNSNTRLLATKGWHGCLVEPLPRQFTELLAVYGERCDITLVNAAITPHGRPAQFFTGREGQLSTVDTVTSSLGNMRPWFTQQFWIPSMTPGDLREIAGEQPFDFVSLDCEGLDLEIAKVSKVLLAGTKLFCYESDRPGQPPSLEYEAQWKEVIAELGFSRLIGKTKGNTFVAR
jgi:FkbM family methyltransferase